jgi:GT2 family glycosyltransferase
MAEELCEIIFDRKNSNRPVIVFLRLFKQDGATVLAFPWRLENGKTRTWPIMLDPSLSIELVSGEPDEQICARVERRGPPPGLWGKAVAQTRKYARALSKYLDRISPDDAAGRIKPWPAKALPKPAPSVSIIIPTRDRVDLLSRAIETLFEKADWPDKELVIVDNGSVEPQTFALFERIRHAPNVQIIRDDSPFNFSRLINAGARAARGDVLAIMNNDVETENPDWIAPLASLACDPAVGIVGTKLLFGDGSVQHAGVVLGIRGIAGHAGMGRAADDPGPYGMLSTTRRVSAVTGACMFVRREIYERLGGMDEEYVVELNDIDFCLRADAAGLAVVYAAAPMLTHNEGSTRQNRPLREQEIRDRQRFIRQWGRLLVKDPYYPADLTLKDDSLAFLSAYDR